MPAGGQRRCSVSLWRVDPPLEELAGTARSGGLGFRVEAPFEEHRIRSNSYGAATAGFYNKTFRI